MKLKMFWIRFMNFFLMLAHMELIRKDCFFGSLGYLEGTATWVRQHFGAALQTRSNASGSTVSDTFYSSKCKFPAVAIWDFDRLRIWVRRGLRIRCQLYGLQMLKIGRSCIRYPVHPARHMPPKIVGECCTKAIFYWRFRPVLRSR